MNSIRNWMSKEFAVMEQFLLFSNEYKRAIKSRLPGTWKIIKWSIGFFYISAFLKNKDNKYIYISCSDVRHFPDGWYNNILIRSAKGPRDYTGGSNNYTNLNNLKNKILKMEEYIKPSEKKEDIEIKQPPISEIRQVETLEDLENLNMGQVFYDVGHRGGGVGFYRNDVMNVFNINPMYLPPKLGSYCNYQGGGIRGSIEKSGFSSKITGLKRKKLEALTEACLRVYKDLEERSRLNEEEYPDGETNWDALATRRNRENA